MKEVTQMSRDLWQEVFEDENSFLDLYFHTLYDKEYSLTQCDYQIEEAQTRLDYIPYRFLWRGKSLKAFYISGVATKSSVRGEGRMRNLLRMAHLKIWQMGGLFSFLIPQELSLYAYYQKVSSYVSIGKARTLHLTNPKFISLTIEHYKKDLSWRKKHLKQPYILHSYAQWKTAYETAQMYGGGAIDSSSYGLLFLEKSATNPEEWLTAIPAWLYEREDEYAGQVYPYGMIRLVNIPLLMTWYARQYPNKELTFDFFDPDLPMNRGRYHIEQGRLLFAPNFSFVGSPISLANIETPETLVKLLFPVDTLFFDRMMSPLF